MGEKTKGFFDFESREGFEQAEKEADIISKLVEKTDFSNPRITLKVYNKLVAEKRFSTVTGYFFLLELRKKILESKLVPEEELIPIPIKEPQEKNDVIPKASFQEGKFRKLYEGQKLLNKKLKIAIAVLVIAIIGFVVINFKFEEELVDKYEHWEEQLKARESKLGKEAQ